MNTALPRPHLPVPAGYRTIPFVKMQGCGNDYIYIDAFDTPVPDPEALAIRLSDRHFGIGGDGVVLICPSDVADARMRMFNLDGSEGMMCGNAIRCVGKYMHDVRGVDKSCLTVETLSGLKYLQLNLSPDGTVDTVRVDMGQPILRPLDVPVVLPGYDGDAPVVDCPVTIGVRDCRITCVSMGNPHCVLFCDAAEDSVSGLDLPAIGPVFEHASLFPHRVNTEFVRVIDDHTLQMRVWERGSGETLACGTGACATVVAAVLNGLCRRDEDICVRLIGGDLIIRYAKDGHVFMTGKAEFAFEGTVAVPAET